MIRVASVTLLAVMLLAGSCATTPTAVVDSFCLTNSPLMPKDRTVSDYISDNDPRLAEGLIAHNLYGEERCGWKF